MASTVVNFAIRGFQVVFAAVVLGLSVSLVRGQAPGANSPISLRYTSFVGGLSLVTAFVGIAGEFFTLIQGKISLIMDTIVALVNIAGGVLLAILIRGANCGDTSGENRDRLKDNHLFNGGCGKAEGQKLCWNWDWPDRRKYLNSRCKECQADTVFMFFIVALMLASCIMTFLRMKRGAVGGEKPFSLGHLSTR